MLLVCAALPLALQAQVTLSAQLPPAGLVQKDQLWNLVLVNNNEDVLNVNIRLNMQDAATGELVLSATTGIVVLNKGVKLVGRNDIQPVLYNYNRDDFSKSFLPMGSYVACYQLFVTSEKGEELLGDECIKLNIDPLSPPLLTSPADKSEIITPYPQFSWVPPAPMDMFSNLNYELLVTEVFDGQSPTEAIQQNTPIYSKSNLTQPYESYASSFTALKPEKVYAWQVVAKNESEYAVKTEVWTFKVKRRVEEPSLEKITPFVKMKKENPEKTIAPDGILKFSYTNLLNDTSLTISVKDMSVTGEGVKLLSENVMLKPGLNLVRLDLGKAVKPEPGHVYMAQMINTAKETWFVMFEIKKSK